VTVTIGTNTYSHYISQPIAYEGDAIAGLTSRKFEFSVFIPADQFAPLIGAYDTWRNIRITEPDTFSSASLGTTVPVTGTFDGVTVTALPCWYFGAPQEIEKVGGYYTVKFIMIDAAQYLQVLLASKEKQRQATEADRPNLGTFDLGGTTVTLLQRAEGYENLPQAELTMTGNLHITGPRAAVRVRNIKAYTDHAGVVAIEGWIEDQVDADLGAGDLLPVSWGQPEAEVIVSGGAKITRYTITAKLVVL
jgi:hypothetical protein